MKLKQIKFPLRKWNKDSFGNIDNCINRFAIVIDILDKKGEEGSLTEVDIAKKVALQGQLEKWFDMKDIYWKQLSGERYVKKHDKNTKYLYALASCRKRRNAILKLKVGSRIVQESRSIKKVVIKFYNNLYK